MKRILIPLLTVAVVIGVVFAGCVPEAAPPVTPPPVTPPPVTPPPVTPPPVTPPPPEEMVFPWEDCFTKPDGSPYRIYFITDQAANVTMSIHTKHMQGVIEAGGGEWTLLNCEQDVARQSAMLEDSLLARPDAIVLHPVAPPTTIPYVEQGTDEGIPFFVSMMPPLVGDELHEDIVAYMGNYQLKRGPVQGQYILDWAEKQGRPIKVSEMWGMYGYEEFSGPVHDTLHETICPGCASLEESPLIDKWWDWGETMFTEDLSYQVCLDGLTANPDVDLIYCECDCMTGGVIAAMKAMDVYYLAGHEKHIDIVTGDAEDWSLAEVEAGYVGCQVDMNIDRYTDGLVKAIWWTVVKGVTMEEVNTNPGLAGRVPALGKDPRNVDVDDTLVIIDNVKEVRAKWASYGKDYYSWPLIEDERYIKYPVP